MDSNLGTSNLVMGPDSYLISPIHDQKEALFDVMGKPEIKLTRKRGYMRKTKQKTIQENKSNKMSTGMWIYKILTSKLDNNTMNKHYDYYIDVIQIFQTAVLLSLLGAPLTASH